MTCTHQDAIGFLGDGETSPNEGVGETGVGLWPGTFLAVFFMVFLDGIFFFRGSERVGPTE